MSWSTVIERVFSAKSGMELNPDRVFVLLLPEVLQKVGSMSQANKLDNALTGLYNALSSRAEWLNAISTTMSRYLLAS